MHFFITFLSFLLAISAPIASAETAYDAYITVDVQTAAITRDDDYYHIPVTFSPDPNWHIYWQNPGDSGLPTTIATWQYGDMISTNTFYPTPEKILWEGMVNYGYKTATTLHHKIPIEQLNNADITLDISYLACKDVCIPGAAKFILPYTALNTASFEASSASYPQLAVTLAQQENMMILSDLPASDHYQFIPDVEGLIDDSAPQKSGTQTLTLARDPYATQNISLFSGILILSDNTVYHVTETVQNPLPTPSHAAAPIGIAFALLLAFIGGIILNLMPCVLPVLSLKVMALIHHKDVARPWVYGLIYTAGVITTFIALAGVLLLLKTAGHEIGWGFQLQSPIFVALLSFLLLCVTLQLFGVFEIGGTLTKLGKFDQGNGFGATFMSGMLMTFVATPCTAPFMASAIGYAFTQSSFVALSVFASLGLGLALPYLMLTIKPGLLSWLPKPGAWMIRLRTFFGFPVLATIIWLVWVYGRQTSLDGAVMLIATLTGFAFSLWLAMQWRNLLTGLLVIVSVLIAGYHIILGGDVRADAGDLSWSLMQEQSALAQGPVFIYFTADWCITCKVNEKLVLNKPETRALFEDHQVTLLRADWTNRNADIASAIEGYGRSGVPLYVLKWGAAEYTLLPQLLTYDIIAAALSANLA